MIFDTHAHYEAEAFDTDRDEILKSMHKDGVRYIMNCGASLDSSRRGLKLADEYPFMYAAVGVHPDEVGELLDENGNIPDEEAENSKLREIEAMAKHPKVLAIGEIGLDYYWDKENHDVQKAFFIQQWKLAIKLGLPIEIHSREAAMDTMDIVREMYKSEQAAGRDLRVDMHCYSYSPEQAAEYVKMGLYFGIGGVLTFGNARKLVEAAEVIPLDRILLETDSPYLAPVPHRGKRNCSAYLKPVAEKLAQIKQIPVEEVYVVTMENAFRFYGRRDL